MNTNPLEKNTPTARHGKANLSSDLYHIWLFCCSDVLSFDDFVFMIQKDQKSILKARNCPKCNTVIDDVWYCYWKLTGLCKACGSNVSLNKINHAEHGGTTCAK